MKEYIYKIIFILFLIPLLAFTNNDKKKYEKSRTINKVFKVNSDAIIGVDNKYGNINIITWSKNRVEIEVKITVKGNNLDAVKDKLASIDVEFNATKNRVKARTIFTKNTSRWSWFKRSNNTNYQINYYIKMPVSNHVNLENDYGAISLNKLEGKATINCDYGKITIGELLNNTNNIELEYCASSTISYMKKGNINIDYSKLTIEKSERIKINSDYSTINFNEILDLDFNADYGSVRVDKAQKINGNGDYTSIKFGTIYKSVQIDTDYGGIKIRNLANNFDFVNITAEYTRIKIGVAPNCNFNFVVDLSYAGFRYNKEKVDMIKSIVKTSKKYYKGTYGEKKTNSKITIKSRYGGVSIRENN